MAPTSCYFFGPCFVGGRKNQQVGHKNSSSRGWGGVPFLWPFCCCLYGQITVLFLKSIYILQDMK